MAMNQDGYRMDCLSLSKSYFWYFENLQFKNWIMRLRFWILVMDLDPKLSQMYKMNLISIKSEK